MESDDPMLTTADMLEIVASGGNGAEYVDLCNLLEQAAKELREKDEILARRAAAPSGWRPIETAPKDGRWILLSAPKMEPETACWDESVWLTGWYCGGGRSDSYGPSCEPTHWMPIPPPPEEDTP